MTRLTFDPGLDEMPLWTPDGNRIVFYSTRDRGGLFSKAADGTGAVESLTSGSTPQIPMAWSEDGTKLLTVSRKGGGGIGTFGSSADIGVLAAEGEHSVEWLTKTDFRELRPAISPDGHWMAYDSDASGRSEVYVRPFPNIDDGLWQLSTDGGRSPTWSFDGKELFYRSFAFAEARAPAMMRVAVQLSPSFSFGPPDVLFEGTYVVGGNDHRMYDLAADGRFLMVVNRATSTQLHVVLNWFEELERLAMRP
jgi:serine/threonine-protein kinase